MRRALEEFTIAGVRTTIPFHEWLVRQPRFLAGDFSTDFIAEEWHPEAAAEMVEDANVGREDGATAVGEGDALAPEELAALVAALVTQEADAREAQRRRGAANGGGAAEDGSRWRTAGRRAGMGG